MIMTGWNQDEQTINFVKQMKELIEQNKHLMPDAWNWLCLDVELDKTLDDLSYKNKIDSKHIAWLKKDQQLLESRVLKTEKLRGFYLDKIDELNLELEMLCCENI